MAQQTWPIAQAKANNNNNNVHCLNCFHHKISSKNVNILLQQNKIEEIKLGKKEEITKEDTSIDPFSKVRMKVGKIYEINEHARADKLYVINVDLGNDEKKDSF